MRVASIFALAITLSWHAPLQCSSDTDPALKRYETPPEALYDLAERFKKQGDEHARRTTLSYLIERYPNSRFAVMARDDLKNASGGDAGRTR